MPTYTLNNVNYTYTVGTVAASVGSSGSATGNINLLSSFVVGGATYNVTSTATNTFLNNKNITSVTIPNSVITIGVNTFNGCSNLVSVTIPNSVTTIGTNAFNNCTKLTSVTFSPDSVLTSLGGNAFYGCSALTTIALPDTITTMGTSTFYNCTNLTNANIPSSVIIIQNNTFYGCTNLASINIPASVTTIGVLGTFYGCANISSIVVHPNNTSFVLDNGALYNTEKTRLVLYPSNSLNITYVIPNTVTTAYAGTFWQCKNLKTLTIPGSISYIYDYFCYQCNVLSTVIFTGNIPVFASNTFINTTATAVYGYNSTVNVNASSTLSMFTTKIQQPVPTLTDFLNYYLTLRFGSAPYLITPPTTDCVGLGPITYELFVITNGYTPSPTATIDGNVLTLVQPSLDTDYLRATQTITRTYGDGGVLVTTGEVDCTLNVTAGPPTLSFSIPSKKVGDAAFTVVPPTSTSTGAFTYTSSNTAVATITIDGVITVKAAGVTNITASQEETTNYWAATVVGSFAVNTSTATISPTITNFSIPTKEYTGAITYFNLTAPTSNSTGAYTYTSSNPTVAYISSGNIVAINRSGVTTITATQTSIGTYKSGAITALLQVCLPGQVPTVLSNFVIPAKTNADISFSIVPPTTNSNGAFTYVSSNTAVATISNNNVVNIIGAGNSTITAYQASTTGYTSASISSVFTVTLPPALPPTITNFSVPAKQIGDATFNLVAPTTNGTGAFTYTSSNTAVATIVGSTVTIIGVGTSTITAVQAGDTNYISGSITTDLVVTQGTLVLTNFSVPVKSLGNADFSLVPPTTISTGLITYTSSDEAVATIVGSTVTIVGIGSSTITASQASTVNLTSATITATLTVLPAPTMTDFSVPVKTVVDASFNLVAPTTNSDGLITYTSSNVAVATITGSKVIIVGAGTTTITAVQASTANYGPSSISATLAVNKLPTTISPFTIPPRAINSGRYYIGFLATSNRAGFINLTSSNTSIFTITLQPNQGIWYIDPVGVGNASIIATHESTSIYETGTFSTNVMIYPVGNYTYDNVNYGYNIGLGTADVLNGTTASRSLSSITVLESFVIDGTTYTVTGVSQSAFSGWSNLTSISLPSTIRTMGYGCFGSTNLTTFTFPPLVTVLEENVFGGSNLTSIIIPSTVTTIKYLFNGRGYGSSTGAFVGCTKLVNIVVNTYISGFEYVFYKLNNVNMSVTFDYPGAVPPLCFQGMNNLKTVIVGNQITSIGGSAFTFCASLTNVTLGSSVTAIGNGAFYLCTSLKNITLPSSLLSIGNGSFSNCTNLNNIILPSSLTTIRYGAFENCTSFTTITLPSSLTTLEEGLFINCTNLTNIVVQKYLGYLMYTFSSINSLNMTVTFDYAGLIPGYVCSNTTKLKTVNMSNTITGVELHAFSGCTGLTEIIFPASITTIQNNAFLNCTNLNSVSFLGNIPTIGGNNFASLTDTAYYKVDETANINTNPTTVASSLSLFANKTVITGASPTITNFSIPMKKYNDISFSIVDPTSNSSGAFSYTSSDTAVATVSGNVVTIGTSGSTTITATQAANYRNGVDYTSGTITTTFVVDNPPPRVGPLILSNKSLSDTSFLIVEPTKPDNSTGTWTYTSSDVTKATISGNQVTLLDVGIVIITATITSDSNYCSTNVTGRFSISAVDVTPSTFVFVSTSDVSNSIPVTVQPVDKAVVLSPTIFTPTNIELFNPSVGTVAEKLENRNSLVNTFFDLYYNVNTISIPPSAFYMPPTIDSSNITVVNVIKTTGSTSQVPLVINASSLNLTTAFFCQFDEVGNSALFNGTNTFTGYNVKITKVSDNNYTVIQTKQGVPTTFTALKDDVIYYAGFKLVIGSVAGQLSSLQLLTLSNFALPDKVLDSVPFTITPPTTVSNGAFTYTSSDTSIATIAGNVVTVVGLGTATITAVQARTDTYLSDTITATLTVNKIPTILSNFVVPAKTYGNAAFTITPPTTNSDGTFTYTSSNTAVATIAGDVVTIVGVGSCTITVVNETSARYTSATTTANFVVNKITPTITNFSVPAKTFGDTSFSIIAPTTDSDGAFTYTSSNTAVATVAGTTITIVGGGSATITANQATTTNYLAATITASLVVSQATPVITNFSVPAKTFGNAAFAITAPTTNSTGAFTYTSSNTAVATVAGSTITIVGGGSATITATQASTTNYVSGTITASLVVSQATPTITNFVVPAKVVENAPFSIVNPTSNSSGAFTYTSSDTSVATIEGNVVTIVGKGTSTITAVQESTTNYVSGSITGSLIVRFTPVITNFSVPAKTFGDAAFAITPPTTDSDGVITYTSSNTAVATIAGSTITIVGGGSATISAVQATTTDYVSGTITASLVVSQATTVLSNFSVPTKTFGNAAFSLVAPTTNGNGAFTYTSSNTAVATIAGSTVTIVGGGTATITANQASTANYLAATTSAVLTVNQATTVLSNFSVPTKIVGNAPFSLVNPTTNSNGVITYTSSNLAVATIAGSTITIVGVGTCTITADQASNANFTSGTITANFQVNQITTVLSGFSVPAKQFANADFSLVAPTTNSPGLFTYTSSNVAVATIVGSTVTIVGVGSATITASQASTTNYLAATTTSTLTVSKATTVLSNFAVGTKTFGDASFDIINPTTNSDGVFTYTSSNTAVATIVNNTMTIVGAGTATITASQATNTNYLAATTTATITVNKATTVLTNFSLPIKVIRNAPFTITAPTTNSNGAFTYTSSNPAVATIAGTTITIVGIGLSTITVNQATTANYLAATTTAVFQVNNVTPTLSFSIPTKTIIDPAYQITPPTSNSTGSFTYTSSNPEVATIVNGFVTIVSLGSTTITAVQAETADYISGTITATLTIIKATPALAFSIPPKNLGNPSFLITPTTDSDGAITYTSSDTSVATIAGNRITIKAVGTSIITVSQASTANYFSATVTNPLQVTLITAVLSNFELPTKTFGDIPFKVQASSNSSGAISYTSSDLSVATFVGDILTILKAGTTTITATQESWYNYASATATTTLQVDPLTTVLTNFSVPIKKVGDATFSLLNPSSNRIGEFTYTSSDTSVATIDGNMVTIVGAGTSTISAVQTSTDNYTSATITSVFTVNQTTPTITNFVVPAKTFGDANFTLSDPTSNSDGAFTYTSTNTLVATVSGKVVTIVGAGSCTINAVQTGTVSYTSGIINAPFVVSKNTPVLTNFSVLEKTFGSVAFKITPPTTTGVGVFTYTSSDTSVATIAKDVVTIVGVGSSTITAVQASTTNFLSQTTTTTLTVTQGTPTITNFSVPTKTAGDATFSLVPPSSNSTGAFTYTSSNTGVATIDGDVVTIVGGGVSTITATQASTTNFSSGTTTANLSVNRLPTVLTNFSISSKTFGNAAFTMTPPTTNSDGLITYTSSNTSVATIDGDLVTIVGAGSATITAVQAMTPTYVSATITGVFQVIPISTVLTSFSVPAKILGDANFTLVPPNSNSNGPLTYTSSNAEVATINGDVVTIVGLGSSTITAVQASTTNYTSRTITATLAVNLITTVLTNFSVPAKIAGDEPFALVSPSSNSTGAFTYMSSNELVATIAGDVVTVVGTGTCTITALQASTPNSISAAITASLVVSKATTVLSNFSVLSKTFENGPFSLVPPTTNSNGNFTYTSSDTSVATIVKDVVTILGIGSTTITATQASTANFLSQTTTATFTVSQGTPVITNFVVGSKTVGDAAFSLVAPSSNSDGAFTYTSSDLTVATVAENVVTIVGRGTSTITATQASTTNFSSGTITALFTINRIPTVLTNFSVPTKTFGDASFTIVPPTSNSDGLMTYASSNTAVATIDGDTVTIVGGGNATITASQASTSSYGAQTIGALFQVYQLKTNLSEFAVPTQIIGEPAFTLTPPTTNGDGAFTYTSSNPAVATIVGDVITGVGLGDCTIRAVQASTANYTSAVINAIFQVKRIRTVLTNFVVPAKSIGDTSFTLVPPTSNSSGAFTYTSSNLLLATVAGDVVTILGTGNVTITAFQESTANSTSAKVTASLTVNKATNTISWFSVPEKAFGNAPFTLVNPTTNSNGAFTYTSSNTAVATISRNVVTIVGVGTSTITAVQANTANYESGTITSVFTVDQGTPVLTGFSIPAKIVGDAAFTLVNPTSNSDGAFTYTSSDLTVATVAGNVVTIVGRGTATITATQASITNFVSGTITSTLQVNRIPTVLTNFAVDTKTFNDATFTITPPSSNSDGAFTYTSSDLSVATINDNVVTIVGAGNAVISAIQARTDNYTSATITALFAVNPLRTVLTNFSVPAKIVGANDFELVAPSSNSDGVFTYTSSNHAVATIVDDVVTIVGLGSSIITAVQASTDDYTSAKITALFEVNLITTVLTNLSVPAKIAGDEPFALTPPSSNSTGSLTYISSNELVATIAGDVVTIVGTGIATITAIQASTQNSTPGIITASLAVTKNTPTITNFSVPEKVFGNAAFKLTPPTTNSPATFTYTSSNTDVATIVKDIVTIVGVGTATITAVQASSVSYTSGTITASFQVNSGLSVLSNFSVPTKTAGSAAFSLVPPRTISNGAFTYTSSDTDVATIDGDVVTVVGAGTATITANQASTANYLSGTITATFTVNPTTTVLTNFAVESKQLGTSSFALVPPTTNSDGAFTYTSSNLSVATIDDDIVTIVGGGISTITAVQASTTNYTSATITASFQVSSLTTVLSNFVMPTKTLGNAPFAIVPPTTNGNGDFTYTSSNSSIATIAGNMVTIVGVGTATITAVQAGTANYLSTTITALFVVNKGAPTISFTMPVKQTGMPNFVIDICSNSTGAFTYTSSNIKVATISKNLVTIKGLGSSIITATQAMTTKYTAGTATSTFVVNQLSPTIGIFTIPATKTAGEPTFKITAPKSNSTSPFTYSSSDITVVKIVKDVVTIMGAGTATITASQIASKVYGPGTVSANITVNKKTTVLNNFFIPTKIIGTAPFAIPPPTTNSNGVFTYTSSNTDVATIVGNMITVVGVGSSTITVNQAMATNFTSATISTQLVVNLPTPQVGSLVIPNKSLTNPSFTIVNPTKPNDSTSTWTYTSSDLTKATVSGNAVTLLQPGIVRITASLPADSLYNSTMLMTQFSISDQNVAPSSFAFIKSSDVAAAIPTTVLHLLNTVIPATVSTAINNAKFNPTAGTVAEKQANQTMVVNTLFYMFSSASVISIPTTLLYVPLSYNKAKFKTTKLVRPTGTTMANPLVINTIASDSTVGFITSIVGIEESFKLNGIGTFSGNFITITRGINNQYSATKTPKSNISTSTISSPGDIITFAGMTVMIGYN